LDASGLLQALTPAIVTGGAGHLCEVPILAVGNWQCGRGLPSGTISRARIALLIAVVGFFEIENGLSARLDEELGSRGGRRSESRIIAMGAAAVFATRSAIGCNRARVLYAAIGR